MQPDTRRNQSHDLAKASFLLLFIVSSLSLIRPFHQLSILSSRSIHGISSRDRGGQQRARKFWPVIRSRVFPPFRVSVLQPLPMLFLGRLFSFRLVFSIVRASFLNIVVSYICFVSPETAVSFPLYLLLLLSRPFCFLSVSSFAFSPLVLYRFFRNTVHPRCCPWNRESTIFLRFFLSHRLCCLWCSS